MNKRFLRRRFVVDWKLQGSLCAHGVLNGVLLLVTVSCGIFLPLLWNLGDTSELYRFEEQAMVMLYMHDRFWVLAGLCLGIVVLGAVRFSHRIAGPLVRYKRNLRLVAAGKLPPPLRTRRGDYLKEEVACLNEAVVGVASRVAAIRSAQTAVRRELHAAIERLPRQQAAQLQATETALLQLEQAVGAFTEHDPADELVAVGAAAVAPSLAGASGEGGV
jgi:hypothetical protein